MPGGICLRAYHYEALSSGGPRAAGRNTLQILGVTDYFRVASKEVTLSLKSTLAEVVPRV